MNNTVKTILTAAATAIAGFAAMVLPFKLFGSLTQSQMRILFVAELIVCAAIYSAVFLKKERKAQRRHERGCRKAKLEENAYFGLKCTPEPESFKTAA